MESLELAHLLVDSLEDKKGGNITLLDIREQATFADYFLICTGDNDRQLSALADTVAEKAKQDAKVLSNGVEGDPRTGWVLVDFGDLIVHLFSPEKRNYYSLEDLWVDAHIVLHLQ